MLPHDDRGSGQTVVLLHAGVCDRSMWAGHLGWLVEAGYRAIAVDLPGFGEAPIQPGPQAPWEDVLITLKELDVDRAVVVGNSFGAALALRMAVVAPAAILGLILISPPPLNQDPSPELAAAWEAEEAAYERGDLDGVATAVVEAWLQPDAPPALRERVWAMQRRAAQLQMAAGEVEEAPDPLDRDPTLLEKLEIPVLTAAGRDDMSDFKQGAEEVARLVPRGQAIMIEGAAHLAPLEAPEEFQALVTGFLATVG